MLKTLFVLVLVGICSALAFGQQGGFLSRPSPFAGSTMLSLATFDEVGKEVGFTAADKAHVDELVQKFMKEMGQGFRDAGDDFEAGQTSFDKLAVAYDDKLVSLLSPAENARLRQLFIQYAGALAVKRADLATELKVTDDQKAQLGKLQTEQHQKQKDLLDQGLPMAAAQEQMRQNREDYKAAVRKLLTPDQKFKLKELEGVHFEFIKVDP